MTLWTSIAVLFRDHVRGKRASERLSNAYRNLFLSGSEDAQIVLADLAASTGFFTALPDGATPEQLAAHNGKRSAFLRIFTYLNMTPEERSAFFEAARREQRATGQKGDFT